MIDYTLPLDELPDPLPIEPLTKPFDVTITPPGSKSITCRAYVLAALAEGESKIIRPLRADDTDKLLDALCTLGAEARWDGEDVAIKGVGGLFPRGGEVNLGDGGTPARFMIACACLASEPVVVDGSPRMRKRPIAEGVDMLRQLGATIEYVEEEGRLPVRVVPSEDFKGGELEVGKTQSSQFVSVLLLTGSCLPDGIRIRFSDQVTSRSYVGLTWRVLHDWGIKSTRYPSSTCTDSGHDVHSQHIMSREYEIESDASSAVYWWASAIVNPGSRMIVERIGQRSSQPDAGFIRIIEQLSNGVYWTDHNSEIIGISRLCAFGAVAAGSMPDASMVLAAIAARATQPHAFASEESQLHHNLATTIRGLHTLRVKETDRIAALANELTKIGCSVETTDDSISILPPHGQDARAAEENPVIIETYNDHRMAMAFAVLGLARPGISISNPKCVAKSYPGFWKDFARLYA